MNYINTNILENELFYNNELILKYHIEYPSIVGNNFENGILNFNCYNKSLAIALKNKIETDLYNEAVKTYKYNKENGYPTMVYEVYKNFIITLNIDNIVSLYQDEYTFTGGAHGNTIRTSQTWNLLFGFIISLASLYPNNPSFIIDILKDINEQISKEPDIYFENTCNLVLNTFNPKSFYLTPNNIVIYFQQYDIAPYSSGIRTFNIDYNRGLSAFR